MLIWTPLYLKTNSCLLNYFYSNLVNLSDVTELHQVMLQEFRKLTIKMGQMQAEMQKMKECLHLIQNSLLVNERGEVPVTIRTLNLPFTTIEDFEIFDSKIDSEPLVREETVS